MSNEEFNKVDLGLYAFDQFKGILARNDFGKMLDLMHPLTEKLATAFGQFLNSLPQNAANVVNEAVGGLNLFASSALVGAPGGTSIGGQANADFQKYLAFLAKLKQPGSTFTGPAQNTNQQFTGPIGPQQPTTGQDYMSMELIHLKRINRNTLSSLDKKRYDAAIKAKTPKKIYEKLDAKGRTPEGAMIRLVLFKKRELERLVAAPISKGRNIKDTRARSNFIRQQKAGREKGVRILTNQLRDLQKKLQNIRTLMRNK